MDDDLTESGLLRELLGVLDGEVLVVPGAQLALVLVTAGAGQRPAVHIRHDVEDGTVTHAELLERRGIWVDSYPLAALVTAVVTLCHRPSSCSARWRPSSGPSADSAAAAASVACCTVTRARPARTSGIARGDIDSP